MKTLRLLLGDQLNHSHSWFSEKDREVVYLMAEMRQETDYVRHHIQKVLGFFASMRNFATYLEERGYRVRYFKISDPENPQELPALIRKVLGEEAAGRFEYQLPDEFRLDQQLRELCNSLDCETDAVDTEHFYTHREELANFFKGRKQCVMEPFYRRMRRKHSVLMDGDQPLGGQWNYDKENRKKWKGDPEIPHERGFRKDLTDLEKEIRDAGIKTLGTADAASFNWPTSRADSLAVLRHFCDSLLVHFGDFQDAMDTQQSYLFHSRLSFALNTKMLSPREVVDRVEAHYRENSDTLDLSDTEGFIRQILGWREYMRGMYWKEMPGYASLNKLDNTNPLPGFFWTGDTRMNCLSHAIGQSLETAYAHHIQRLMVTGNYALLTQTDPEQVDAWYLGIYIDAVQWVELPNTRGMSQFADGGLVATKPYVSSANYIRKMSNYCSGCHYSASEKTGEKACPFNALYWNFLDSKKELLKSNPRMGMMYRLLEKMDAGELEALKKRAQSVIAHPERF
ncbi:cryptochrome/photolyase family protein [Robiginitalea sp. SC105]|uniref:cryptochrome/photolyase family protein n=1 Tax=Robiginitalea sp. SC105 TaxID=2762332 RepID=UPI0016398F0C|nr:cryptochrome/photolyase family protein [Robiginitalea sp. SC105]MBC2839065.1 cryptochrome/photolyase family protein [Robiginitalea sp. SC105]